MLVDIEKSILCSILENDFIAQDKRIAEYQIKSTVFQVKEHQLIAKAIIRLKELREPICTDTLKDKFESVRKWTPRLESVTMEIITQTPFSSFDIFDKYYKTLEQNVKNKLLQNIMDGV